METDPNTTLPELDSKDSEEEWKTSCHSFAHCMDVDFAVWRDKKISQGLKQWHEWDKMTCDHVEPGKEAKYPDSLGTPLDYMESHEFLKPIKMSEYNLCCFYQVGLSGDFLEFPTPCKPATNDHIEVPERSISNRAVAHSTYEALQGPQNGRGKGKISYQPCKGSFLLFF